MRLGINLEYPEKLHGKRNTYLLAPEKRCIEAMIC